MAADVSRSLSPRKRPRQARASVTVHAIFEATIQLLLVDGLGKLTTTRVAERAGVSVGTMYQYFPHKQSLVYALNERYLDVLAEKIEVSCEAHRNQPIARMLESLIDTYWLAKTERADVTRALYRSVAEMDNEALIDAFARRVDAAAMSMFASASDAVFENLETVNLTLLTVIFGTVRNVFERNLAEDAAGALRDQLVVMCQSYAKSAAT